MTYFPEPIFRNITSFLIDPYKRDREAHERVWKTICVKRCVDTSSIVYEADFTQEHRCGYLVYVHDIRCSDDASIPTANFGPGDMPSEWDNVEQTMEAYNPDGSFLGETFEHYNSAEQYL